MNATATGLQEGNAVSTSTGNAIDDLYPSTPAIDKPKVANTLNTGRITGVTEEQTQAGQTYVKVHLSLLDEGKDVDKAIFFPAAYVEDIFVDPNTLSDEDRVTASGSTAPSDRKSYGQVVRNTSGDAQLQLLGKIASEAGQTIGSPKTFSKLVQGLNAALQGADVYVTRTPDKNPKNAEFANMLRVRGIFPASTDINTKRFVGFPRRPFQS